MRQVCLFRRESLNMESDMKPLVVIDVSVKFA